MDYSDIDLTLRFLMNQKQASQVIGRNASNIKNLRDQTECNITLSSREHEKRILTIAAKKSISMKTVSRLGEILEAENNEYGKSTKLVPITLTLVIPKNICGMIIGKGGEALKDLRVKSGAQINISADCLPKSDERTCQITGNNISVTQAIDLLIGIMIKAAIDESKGEFKGTPSAEIRAYDPKNAEEPAGRSEKDDKLMQMATAFMTANQMINPTLEYSPIEINDQLQELRVPNQHMGAIIGKGGKRIGEIRMMSGCNIHVERSDADSNYGMRRLTLKGTKQQITMAAYLVNQTISSFSTAEPKIPKEEVTIKVEEQEQPEAQVGSFVDPMSSTNTEQEAAKAMANFFATQFSGDVSYDPTEYVNTGASGSHTDPNRKRRHREQPDMYKVPDKKPAKLHY